MSLERPSHDQPYLCAARTFGFARRMTPSEAAEMSNPTTSATPTAKSASPHMPVPQPQSSTFAWLRLTT